MKESTMAQTQARFDRVRWEPGVYAIVGATGIGKSAEASKLALSHSAPIVVADRIQCYSDLLVTSGRAFDAKVEGLNRVWLDNRTIHQGNFDPDEAFDRLIKVLTSYVDRGEAVVMEGGSISLILRFAQTISNLPFPAVVNVMPIPDRQHYFAQQCARARQMLRGDSTGRNLLTELAEAWVLGDQHNFIASVAGLDCVLDWCATHSVTPEELANRDLTTEVLDELAASMGGRYVEHGVLQQEIFLRTFGAPGVTAR
ncbi:MULTISPECIES: adenylate dimethylallyltransferase Fas4 [Nocardiaceae]|uniref:Adenylate dimethylallyltransferase n=4 Tax=Nocardiaceae TaxID=85025 RepID=IPT_RHOFA|nr:MULTISPECIES: adenylate dimethylallyltransferase Fas4 [Rhodococcus]P46376.1 RecName: Full=Adenylate dimethylallyltransferase; AltName: Full=Dimethylallyl transferase; AltName: Full=Isopentenyl transferase [Rhodococcus fascians]AET25216.1 isopentenyl transferase [Rhodococcus fascians D188]AMY56243.1 Adenylate dimethylallyltransferase [Rhodococcus fascians D188]OZC43753.1 (dimethylallyl)adenosine tRNA methylthiotransferase [Rhodococcus sp. RS1C4]OZC51341.1 (dimethylallyl)adenosine tRNA methyl